MADEKPQESPAAKPGDRRKAGQLNRAQMEFDRYKARVGAAVAPGQAGFAGPPAFSIGAGAGPAWVPASPMMAGSPWGGPDQYAGLGFPYGALPAVPPVPPNSLTDRLRHTVRLGVDVVNATLSGGLRVLGGLSEAAGWAGQGYGGCQRRGGGHGGCGCSPGGASSCCGPCDPCSCCGPCDPCGCQPNVSSCGCGCC